MGAGAQQPALAVRVAPGDRVHAERGRRAAGRRAHAGIRRRARCAGNVIYPAEAFLYGGRTRIVLPAEMPQFATKQGNPGTQIGLSTQYRWNGLGITLSGNYFSSVCSGRLCAVELPAASVIDAGVFWDMRDWHFKLDVLNALDERYYRARTGDALGDPLAQAMPRGTGSSRSGARSERARRGAPDGAPFWRQVGCAGGARLLHGSASERLQW